MPRFSSKSSSRSSSPTRNSSTVSKPISTSSVAPFRPSSVPATYHAPQPTLMQSMKEGFGLGVGVSIARNLVDRAFGTVVASAPVVATTAPKQTVLYDTKLYEQCIQNGATEEFCRQIATSNSIKSDSETK